MIELHRKLLGDTVRNAAFHEALKRVVKPGVTTVADVGAGTGFLSFLASCMGARHCTLYEYSEILDVAKKLAARNGIRNLTFVQKHTAEVTKAGPFDVLISETLGNYALEENIIESIEGFHCFLKPNGVIIPCKIRQFVCPVTSDRLMKEIDVFPSVGFDLDFTDAREVCLNNMYVKNIKKEDLFAGKEASRRWDTIDFSLKNKSVRTEKISWKGPATIHGFALWWEAELVPGVTLSTSPFAPPTHWEQVFLPLLQPVTLKSGETLECHLRSDTRPSVKINLTWTARHVDSSGTQISEQRMDMKKGYIN